MENILDTAEHIRQSDGNLVFNYNKSFFQSFKWDNMFEKETVNGTMIVDNWWNQAVHVKSCTYK